MSEKSNIFYILKQHFVSSLLMLPSNILMNSCSYVFLYMYLIFDSFNQSD